MKKRSVLRRLLVPLFAVAALLLAAAPSSANPAPQHCVINVESGQEACFDTLAEALGSTRAASGEFGVQAYSLLTMFDWINYDARGGTTTWTGSRHCSSTTADKDYRYPTLVPYNWNDRPSSVKTYASCDVWFSSDINYEGECGNRWLDASANLSAQGCYNRASSLELS